MPQYIFYRSLNLKATIELALNKGNGSDDDDVAVAFVALKFIHFPFECIAFKCFPTVEKETEHDCERDFLLLFSVDNLRKLITVDAHPNDIFITFTLEIPYFSFHFYRINKSDSVKLSTSAMPERIWYEFGVEKTVRHFSGI